MRLNPCGEGCSLNGDGKGRTIMAINKSSVRSYGSEGIFLRNIKLFFSLSRTPHGILDMATPALSALLWLGAFPSWQVIILGLTAAFAGYTAVYALNDLVDFKIDKEKMKQYSPNKAEDYLDAMLIRHPIAQGFLSYKKGVVWVFAWGGLALTAAYSLNPVCAWILLLGVGLEIIYCLTNTVTHLRTLISGIVKTLGGIAGVFAVAPHPSFGFLFILFAWLFFWEIGGQKVPADWYDIEEDRRLGAKTIPVKFGRRWAGLIVLVSLGLAVIISVSLFEVSPAEISPLLMAAVVIVGAILLLLPALHLYRIGSDKEVSALFKRASLYPFVLLIIVSLNLIT
jgi:4-hydroxybenzoate polyprenyltransferase